MLTPEFAKEQIIRHLDTLTGTQVYYGFDLSIQQSDVPYTVVPGSRPPSDSHFVVCGDTVTIAEPLVNPGRNIVICAREVILAPGVTLDVSGGDPAADFAPTFFPQQTDTTAGAAGASGQAGSTGQASGSVRLLAETVTMPTITNKAVAAAVTAALQSNALGTNAMPSGKVLLPVVSEPWALHGVTVTVELQSPVLTGSWLAAVGAAGPLQEGEPFTLSFTLASLTLASATTIWLPDGAGTQVATVSGPLSVQATATLAVAADTGRVVCRQVVVSLENFAPQISIFNPDPLFQAMMQEFAAYASGTIQPQIEAALQPLFATTINTVCGQLGGPLTLLARGGPGGRGQDGHPGNKGAQGLAGSNDYSHHYNRSAYGGPAIPPGPPEADGGPGGPGGPGGAAGPSGTGGAGGRIEYHVVRGSAPTVKTDASGGPGGAAARGGQGGEGGDGGAAGSYICYQLDKYGFETGAPDYYAGHVGSPGGRGSAGSDRLQGANGAAGEVDCDGPDKRSDYAAIAWSFPLDLLLISQRVAAMCYLNAQTADDDAAVVQALGWLVNLTTPLLGTLPSGSAWTSHELAVAQNIHASAVAQLANFKAGLDYYGHPADWVPLRSLSDYETALSALLASGKDIEDQFNLYQQQAATGLSVKDQLTQTRASLTSAAAALAARVTALDPSITDAQGTIDVLTVRLQQQRTIIARDQAALAQEFNKFAHADSCGFMDVLNGVEKIMTLGGGLADGMKEISAALEAEGGVDGSKLFKGVKDGLAAVQKIDVTITDLQKSVDAISAGLQAISQAVPPSNPDEQQALLITDQQNFDGFIGKFLADFDAAATLKQDVDDYFAMIRARNQAIVTYNGLYATRAKLQAQQAQCTSHVELMAAQLANAQSDPSLPINVSFMRSALSTAKETIVAQLYEKNRAYWYWSLVDRPLAVDDLTIATLSVTNDGLDAAISEVKAGRGRIAQSFTQKVSITAADYPTAFAQLWRSTPTNRRLSFAITPEHVELANPYRVLVNQFTLSFPDLSAADAGPHGSFNVYLIHPGTAFQLTLTPDPADPSRRAPTHVDFCHAAIRDVSYTVNVTSSGSSGGGSLVDEGSVGVSPYTQWTLDFEYPYPNPDEDWLTPEVLSKIRSVQITFSGSFISPSPNEPAALSRAAQGVYSSADARALPPL
jgi:hypothetical protein